MRFWRICVRIGVLFGALTLSWGASAEERVPLGEVAHIHGVAFDPEDASRVLLATHYGLFEALPDGTAARISGSRDDFMGFTAVPGRDDLLLASGHSETDGNLGFIASSDGGATWRQVSEGALGPVDFHALTISRVDQQVLYGLYRGIQASQDGGATWQLVGPGPEGVIDLAASAADKERLFAATGSGLQVSSDGGRTWEVIGPASPVTMVETGADGRLYAFFAGAGLFSADPDASKWTSLNEDLAGREFLHMASEPGTPDHLVAVTHSGEVLESRDGGKGWSPLE